MNNGLSNVMEYWFYHETTLWWLFGVGKSWSLSFIITLEVDLFLADKK